MQLTADSQNRTVGHDEIASAEDLPMIEENTNAERTAGPSTAVIGTSMQRTCVKCVVKLLLYTRSIHL
jgi:hypothetical protein